jgi:competence protein ComEC
LALAPMSWGIDAVAAIARGVTGWRGAVLNVPSMPAEALILVVLGGVRLCIWTRRWRWLGLAPIAAGYLMLAFVRPPDLLVVAESAQSEKSLRVAVRAADGSYLWSSARGSRITAEIWTRRAAAESGPAWPAAGASADGALACDALGCLYGARGRVVALSATARRWRRTAARPIWR